MRFGHLKGRSSMSRFARQMLLTGLIVVVSIFFGIDLASRGIERVHGPVTEPAVAGSPAPLETMQRPEPQSVPVPPAAFGSGETADAGPATEPGGRTGDSLINRLADKTGELLQILAHHLIRWFVSLLNGFIN